MLYSTVTPAEKRRLFRERLASGELLRFPGAFNPLSARLIEQKGFRPKDKTATSKDDDKATYNKRGFGVIFHPRSEPIESKGRWFEDRRPLAAFAVTPREEGREHKEHDRSRKSYANSRQGTKLC